MITTINEFKQHIKENKSWYAEQADLQKLAADKNKNICIEIKNALPIYATENNLQITDISNVREHYYTNPFSYGLSFDYLHPDNKIIGCEMEVRHDGEIYKTVGGAVYELKSKEPMAAIKEYLDYINKVSSNRL